ncbi:PREDICTED: 28 kDa heat- and acid-stable phosphoprotein isoform X1 [Mandrillus leucophaeus]|uniref:28 kDa heat- and acid-stable phosphoprotein isoform X1 n=2 Tax=Cercopithecidae TaxID=9527 RepID=UPI0005F58794|nr:PREDICTED: 28 kDa heat- and acid-stable phosphoprotein isoform X1 [Mandrillus leucophaeus]
MPKGGRKGGHKGRARQYTSPEEIDAQLQAEKQKAREEEEQKEGGDGAAGDPKKEKKSLDSDESEDEEDDYQQKRKGVEGLIDIENPNRVAQTTKKVTQLDLDGPKELSRREREEIEKQKAKERYMKMHLAGKTEQAKADLARLAIIRKQREEAARKKEEERKGRPEVVEVPLGQGGYGSWSFIGAFDLQPSISRGSVRAPTCPSVLPGSGPRKGKPVAQGCCHLHQKSSDPNFRFNPASQTPSRKGLHL